MQLKGARTLRPLQAQIIPDPIARKFYPTRQGRPTSWGVENHSVQTVNLVLQGPNRFQEA
jgi:hypothetical protein